MKRHSIHLEAKDLPWSIPATVVFVTDLLDAMRVGRVLADDGSWAAVKIYDPDTRFIVEYRRATPDDLYVLRIEHKHGCDVSLHRTREDATAARDAYVEEWWDRELPGEIRPPDLEDRCDQYFDEGHESYSIDPVAAPA